MSTKIQINDLKALEALLRGDPEFEVEFRKSVLLEYEKKHILPLVQKRVDELVLTAAGTVLGRVEGYPPKLTLSKTCETTIKSVAREVANEALRGVVEQIVKEVLDKGVIQANVVHSATVRAVEEYKANLKRAMG